VTPKIQMMNAVRWFSTQIVLSCLHHSVDSIGLIIDDLKYVD